MKKTIILLTALAGLFLAGFKPSYSPITQGTIIYEVTDIKADHLNPLTKMMVSDSKITVRFQGNHILTEMKMPLMKNTTILDGKTHQGLTLIEKFMDKIAVPMDEEDLAKQRAERGEISSVSVKTEKKIIQGFICRRAIIKTSQGAEVEMFFTEDIQPPAKNSRFQFTGIDGFPLEMDMYRDGRKLRLVAVSVETNSVKPQLFSLEIPKGFEVKTFAYLQELRESWR